uniref:Carbonic anhydrase n=1 Tax=Dunaliella salina TaxID=3046 RepID=Q84UY1_DUNSA|nr:carbonic anhydrase [Dunaliella salina]
MARLALLGAALLCALAVSTQGSPEGHGTKTEMMGAGRLLQQGPHTNSDPPYNYNCHGFDWAASSSSAEITELCDSPASSFPVADCDGDMQSPINIVTSELADPTDRSGVSGINLRGMGSSDFVLRSNVKVNIEQDMKISWDAPTSGNLPTIMIDGTEQRFQPIQLHFHHFASEHTINGQLYPLEAHLVMASLDDPNQLAVIGTMYKYGNGDDFLARLFGKVEDALEERDDVSYGSKEVPIDMEISPKDHVLPQSSLEYAGYDGSLTTPPCSEVVKWHVFTSPRTISIDQLKTFERVSLNAHPNEAIPTNNRVIQPLGTRAAYRYEATAMDDSGDGTGNADELSSPTTVTATYDIMVSGTASSLADMFNNGARLDNGGFGPDDQAEADLLRQIQRRARANSGAEGAEVVRMMKFTAALGRRRLNQQGAAAEMDIRYYFEGSTDQEEATSAVNGMNPSSLGSSSSGLTDVQQTEVTSSASSLRAGLGLVVAAFFGAALAL